MNLQISSFKQFHPQRVGGSPQVKNSHSIPVAISIDSTENPRDRAAQYGAPNIRIFGSLARQEAHTDSDVDFLMDLDFRRGLLNRIALMQNQPHCKVL